MLVGFSFSRYTVSFAFKFSLIWSGWCLWVWNWWCCSEANCLWVRSRVVHESPFFSPLLDDGTLDDLSCYLEEILRIWSSGNDESATDGSSYSWNEGLFFSGFGLTTWFFKCLNWHSLAYMQCFGGRNFSCLLWTYFTRQQGPFGSIWLVKFGNMWSVLDHN